MSPKFTSQRVDRYEAAQRAAQKVQEVSGTKPAPLSDQMSEEQKKLLEATTKEVEQQQKAQEKRDKLAQEGKQLDEIDKQLRRPGNQVNITVPNSYMKMWFALPKGAPDTDENLIALVNGNEPLSDAEVLTLAVELGKCEKELTDRIVKCAYEVVNFFGEVEYDIKKRYGTLTAVLEKQGIQSPRILSDGKYDNVVINLGASTRGLPMVLSKTTMALGDNVLLAIEPSYKKAKTSFIVKGGAPVDEVPTIKLSDLPS